MWTSYEAIYDRGTLSWTRDQPPHKKLRVLVTVLEEVPVSLEEKREIWERARGCVKPPKTREEIDRDIREMRAEWDREWDK